MSLVPEKYYTDITLIIVMVVRVRPFQFVNFALQIAVAPRQRKHVQKQQQPNDAEREKQIRQIADFDENLLDQIFHFVYVARAPFRVGRVALEISRLHSK